MIRRLWWKFRDVLGLWPDEVCSLQLAAYYVEHWLRVAAVEPSGYRRASLVRCAQSSAMIGWSEIERMKVRNANRPLVP